MKESVASNHAPPLLSHFTLNVSNMCEHVVHGQSPNVCRMKWMLTLLEPDFPDIVCSPCAKEDNSFSFFTTEPNSHFQKKSIGDFILNDCGLRIISEPDNARMAPSELHTSGKA